FPPERPLKYSVKKNLKAKLIRALLCSGGTNPLGDQDEIRIVWRRGRCRSSFHNACSCAGCDLRSGLLCPVLSGRKLSKPRTWQSVHRRRLWPQRRLAEQGRDDAGSCMASHPSTPHREVNPIKHGSRTPSTFARMAVYLPRCASSANLRV